MIKKLGKGVRP